MAPGETVRLFVALDIPEALRGEIAAWQRRELADPAVRPVSEANLHMTLCFLGSTPAERIEDATRIVTAVEPRPVPFRPTGLVLKPGRRPSLVAMEAESPAAAALHAELSGRLSEAGLHEPEDREFWPHVTFGRVRNEPGKRRPQRLGSPPGELPEGLLQGRNAVRVSLYRSNIRSGGAHYVPLATLNLPPSA